MSLTAKRPIPNNINQGLSSPPNRLMLELLGSPRNSYDQACRPPTNRPIKNMIRHKDVGPFKVPGLEPAVDSLTAVMNDIRIEQPDVYAALGHMGMLCCRNVRGSTSSISNHSFGTAIDLTIEGELDPYGDGTVQLGLIRIYPIFNRHGWYWGAAFRKEDGMHFEVSRELMLEWNAQGRLGDVRSPSVAALNLSRGARGVEVRQLQEALVALGIDLDPDGIFGAATEAAVIMFQQRYGLTVDGIAGPKVFAMLKEVQGTATATAAAGTAATTVVPVAPAAVGRGEFDGDGLEISASDIEAAAAELNVEPAALWAVKTVESGPYGTFLDDGRPPILYERHIFHRRSDGRFASHPDLSQTKAGGYGKSGAHQYTRLERAMKLDRSAALEAASWGAFQLLGLNWQSLNYASVEDLVAHMLTAKGQLDGLVRFIRRNRLEDELRTHNWAGFARAYNGPAYKKNNYDTKLAQAFEKARREGAGAPTGHTGHPILRMGDNGPAVEELQRELSAALGTGIAVDGDFGPATKAAVLAFQKREGLKADGVVGPLTWGALEEGGGDDADDAPAGPRLPPNGPNGVYSHDTH